QQNNARQTSTPGDPLANGGQSIDISDENLPF
ncbi:single-stranded DNA-binding protein, partial [Pediococcus acidilactici]|nr:single-stranded DNA-binding protein [Pediococcus acidilactici]